MYLQERVKGQPESLFNGIAADWCLAIKAEIEKKKYLENIFENSIDFNKIVTLSVIQSFLRKSTSW